MRTGNLLLLVWLGACNSPSPAPTASSPLPTPLERPRVLRTDELPERERTILSAWRAGGAQWAELEPSVLANPDERSFLVDNLVRDLVRHFEQSKLAGIGEADGPFERSRAQLVRMPADSTPLLVELTAKGDGVVAYLSADLLIAIGPGARAPVAARCSDPSASVRRRMVELWGKLPAGETPIPTAEWERLGALARHDPDWLVRGEAQSSLASIGAQQQNKGFVAGILRQGLADPDLAVAQKAAEGFGVLGEPRAIPWLIDGLTPLERKGAAAAVKAGRKSLEVLSGEQRDRTLPEWQEWWDRIGSRR